MKSKPVRPRNLSQPEYDYKIAVIDDDTRLLKLIKNYFYSEKIQVDTFADAQTALELVNNELDYSLVILDIMLPGFSGLEICRKFREKYQLYELPILILTSRNTPDDVVEAFDAGANDYIAKPFEKTELISRSKTLINLHKLINANRKLQNAIEFKNQLMQMAIHDLRNPLTIIIGLANLLKQDLQNNVQKSDFLNLILDSAGIMLNMINEILHNVRIDSGKLLIKRETINMNIIALNVIEKNRRRALQKGQELIFSPSDDNDSYVISDSLRLFEIIDNLISNAIKFSDKNKRIWINVNNNIKANGNDNVRLSVKDEGPGLSDDDMKLIFTPFQKLSAEPTDGEHSSGIGLTIVKQLIELLDGKIWVESNNGNGSEFFIEFKAKA